MDQIVILNPQEQEQLLRAIESAVHVRRRHQFFLWAQGQLFSLIPHSILVCLRVERGGGASHVECLHSMLFDPQQEILLCDPHIGLPVRLARRCEELGLLPGLIEPGANRYGRLFEEFRPDLEKAGVRNALVHGNRIEGHTEAVFFMLLDVVGQFGPVQAHLMQLMMPHLHLAFQHVIGYNGQGVGDAGGDASGIVMSGREREILRWMCTGKSNGEIGALLSISPLTVKNHVQKIFRKFNVHNRAQAVSRAVALNLYHDSR